MPVRPTKGGSLRRALRATMEPLPQRQAFLCWFSVGMPHTCCFLTSSCHNLCLPSERHAQTSAAAGGVSAGRAAEETVVELQY
jgi:hypothetical protein